MVIVGIGTNDDRALDISGGSIDISEFQFCQAQKEKAIRPAGID